MQRAIWIITFFIILAIGYFWLVVDDTRTQQMVELADSDKELSGDVNSTVEVYDRLEKKWIGTSKHVQTLQIETHNHYKAYVGPPSVYDLVGAMQFNLLTSFGLRDFHKLLDIGCGSLRAG